jgi:hypothetical protein
MRKVLGWWRRLAVALVLTALAGSAVQAQITQPLADWERQALIDFYNGLDGDNWVDNSGWKTPEGEFSPPGTEGTWFGVETGWSQDPESHGEPPVVISLSFSDNGLSGTLGGLLDPFDELVFIHFSYEANLHGVLPNLWDKLYLQDILIDHCGITGALPESGAFSLLPRELRTLVLADCPLNITWDQIMRIQSGDDLDILVLSGITLGGSLPADWSHLAGLERLYLDRCGLTGPLPATMPPQLEHLVLSNNALEGTIPASWGGLNELVFLWLDRNRLTGVLPASLASLTQLQPAGGLQIQFNALETDDPALWQFCVDKHYQYNLPDGSTSGDWREGQARRPDEVTVVPTADGQFLLSWPLAPNVWQTGHYVVEESTDGVSWTFLQRTADRWQTSLTAPSDSRRMHHWFRVSTVWYAHALHAYDEVSLPRVIRHTDALFFDDFETPQAWSLSGDFAIGAPQPGNGASQAWSGTALLGTNLAGAHADNQDPGEAEAITPSFSCAGKTHVKLAFRSFSRFDGFSSDLGTVSVSVGGGAWQTLEVLDHFNEDGWERHWVDLSPLADNQPDVRLRFAYTSDASFGLDGWNVDEVAVVARTPVSGVFTVDPAGTLAGNFTSLGEAFSFFNSVDLAGPTAVEVAAGAVFEEELEPLFVGATQASPLTFRRSGAGTNPLLRSVGGEGYRDATLKLRGAAWVSFEGIDVEAGGQVEHAVQLVNRGALDGCSHVSLRDLAVRGGRFAGVFSGTVFQPQADSGANSHLTLERVVVDGSATAVLLDNNWNTGHMDVDNQVLSCTLGSAESGLGGAEEGGCGLRAQGQNGLRVENCEISHVRGFMATGLQLSGANLLVASNRIHSLDGGWRVTGIRAEGAKLFNNMVALEDDSEGAEIVGIALEDGYNSWCDFNSVRVQGQTQSTSDCLSLSNSTAARVSNNILVNLTPDQPEGWRHAAISVGGTPYFTSTGSLCDANLVHVPSIVQGGVGFDRYIQQPLADLAAWRSATGADQLSVAGDPNFVSATDLHLRSGQPTPAEAAGMWLQGAQNYPWLGADLDGDTRNLSAPDIGADEGDFASPSELPWEPYALSPQPGEAGVALRPTLRSSWSWDNLHPVLWTEFYLGTDSLAVAACDESARVLADGSAQSEWTPAAPLAESTRHFWQVRTCNWSGCTAGGVWSFTTEGVVRDFPFCESFDTQVPPAGWRGRLNQNFDGGLNGNNLQPTWGMGWFLTSDAGYVHSGSGAAQIHPWMMPAFYWLLSPALDLPDGGTAAFRLRFEHSEFQPTELHLVCDTGAGWTVLRSWNGPEDACGLETEQQVALPGGASLRLAFVYNAGAQGTPVSLDDLCVTTGGLETPVLEISDGPDGFHHLSWTEVPGAAHYRVEIAAEIAGPWQTLQLLPADTHGLDVLILPPRRFYRVVALD